MIWTKKTISKMTATRVAIRPMCCQISASANELFMVSSAD